MTTGQPPRSASAADAAAPAALTAAVNNRDGCQHALDAAAPNDPARQSYLDCARLWQGVIDSYATPTASPSPSGTPTPSASPSGSPSPTATTPSPSPTQPSPSPTPTDTPPAAWPGATNTGVPLGTTLTPWTGSCTLPAGVYTGRIFNCRVTIGASGVDIRSSLINGAVLNDAGRQFSLTDVEVNAGHVADAAVTCIGPDPAHWSIMLRVNAHGGHAGAQSNGAYCAITDSWLHGQGASAKDHGPGSICPTSADGCHLNGWLTNGGHDIALRHNMIACTDPQGSGGCTGPFALFGDFAPVSNITADGNYFAGQDHAGFSQAYCAYGGIGPGKAFPTPGANIVFTNNVFGHGQPGDRGLKRCGYYGATTGFDPSQPGYVFRGNHYDDPNATPVCANDDELQGRKTCA